MEENTNLQEQTADQRDAFLDGWGDDVTAADAADQQEEQEEVTKGNETDTTEENPAVAEESDGTDAESENKEETAEESEQTQQVPEWNVKHMGETKTLKAEDITAELLQKGMDYDRIRSKYEESKPVMEMFTEFAKQANMSVSEYAKFIRTEAKKAAGMSEDESKRAVELEDREAVIAEKEAAQKEEEDAKNSQDAKVKRDLEEFARDFPEDYNIVKSDPEKVPKSVWDDVNKGSSLSSAWARYKVAQAKSEAEQARKAAESNALERKNADRSTGSMKSAGSGNSRKDAFSEAFDNL